MDSNGAFFWMFAPRRIGEILVLGSFKTTGLLRCTVLRILGAKTYTVEGQWEFIEAI